MSAGRLVVGDVDVDDLVAVLEAGRRQAPPSRADDVVDGVPVYDCGAFVGTDIGPLQAEWAEVLLRGAGILVLRGAFDDHRVIDDASAAFFDIIAAQQASGQIAGDHYAKPGANDRIWNALEKLAINAPDVFVRYYANAPIAAICEAWLGPAYQITSQVNVVNPGGQAQMPHCDYHLGFLTDDVAAAYPAHVHSLSPMLTLQGAVAHCDMPVETGPTMYLPHSQKYSHVFLSWRHPDVISYFDQHRTQLALAKGDAVFFNPSLLHAAGTNRTGDIRRMANLLQVSSAFGRAMEAERRQAMCEAVYPAVLAMADRADQARVIAATAEGYPFPTHLDADQPIGGLAPPSQADVMAEAIAAAWPISRLQAELTAHADRRRVA